MADITLHSGSFCDRNNDEITITFFKRSSTPVMTVDPTALSFTSNGGTKTLRVSNYTGTLSISVSGGTGWLGYTQSTSSGVRTYTFTATANNTTSLRNATITLTDNNNTVTVGVTQAGATSFVEVNPNYLVFNSRGETKTTTVTWAGGSTPTWSNAPEWASITSSVSGGTMTLTINVGVNTTQYQRTGTVYVSNGISRADLALEQSATHTVAVSPSSFTFTAAGGTQELTITNIEGSFSMNYQGDFLTLEPTYTSSTIRRYNVICSANPVRAQRTGVINVKDTAGDWVAVPVTQAASTESFAVSPTSFEYAGSGSTNTFTFTGSPSVISYNIPEGVDWVTVSNLSTSSVDITTSANQTPNSRTTTVMFYNDFDMSERVFVTVNQAAGAESLSVTPSSITYLPAGGTYGITATWTAGTEPTATITYVQGAGGWMTPTGSGTVTGNTKEWAWTASANYTGSSRTALITVTNGLQTEQVTVSQSSTTPPVAWAVVPSVISNGLAAGNTYSVSIAGAPSGGMSYDVDYDSGNNWITITNFTSTGCSLTTSANSSTSARDATVKYIDQDDVTHYITTTVHQYGQEADPLYVYDSSMSFAAAGGRGNTIVENIVGTLTTTQPSWITLAMSGEGGSRAVSVTAASNSLSTSRSGSVVFDDDRQSPVSMEVEQAGATPTLSVSPMSITYLPAGGTYGITATWTIVEPTATLTYVDGAAGWLTQIGNGTVNGNTKEWAWTASANNTGSSRTARVDVTNGTDTYTVAISQASGSAEMTVTPSTINLSYIGVWPENVELSNIVEGPGSYTTSDSWISCQGLGDEYLRQVTIGRNTTGSSRSGSVTFTDYGGNTVVLPITQGTNTVSSPLTPDTYSLTFNASDGDGQFTWKTIIVSNVDRPIRYTQISGSDRDWCYVEGGIISIGDRIDETTYKVRVAVLSKNTSTSSRSCTFTIYDYRNNPVTITVTQLGTGGGTGISVSPSQLNFPYTSSSDTLTVSGVSGYNTSLSYTGVSGWLSVLSNANTITVSASGTTYPSSRTATLTVTNASDATDSVAIPISQAGNPGVLSVTPNAWNYPSSLSYHEFTVTYVSTGTIDYTVAYDRQPGEEEIDWLAVELVDHEEGTETWTFSIDVGPNNTGSGRAAMVTFEGDGGGVDEVSVYQQP